jgi:predicted transcriptional regulator
MDLQTEKLDIIKWIAGVNERKIIKQFALLKEMNQKMASVKLDPFEKQAIDAGLDSIKAGRFKSHQEVTEATKKKYPHLF